MDETASRDTAHLKADGGEPVRVTVTMTRGQHRAIKRRASEHDLSVSELVRRWIAEDARSSYDAV